MTVNLSARLIPERMDEEDLSWVPKSLAEIEREMMPLCCLLLMIDLPLSGAAVRYQL